MAKIIFYEATEVDQTQLNAGLQTTDHHWIFVSEPLSPETVDHDAEVISVFVGHTVSRELIELMPRLKLIATRSTGFDHIDMAAAAEHGVTVVNVPSYGENTVAEHAFTLLLALARKLVPTVESTKEGVYEQSLMSGFDLKGKRLGIVGMGRIGQHTARIGRGFGMEVVGYDPFEKPEVAAEIGFAYAPLDEVIGSSDVISLHLPLTDASKHLINEQSIARMKPGVVLINASRGELVDTNALIAALESGHVAGAGLDTIEGERFLDENVEISALLDRKITKETLITLAETEALLRMPQVIITPHSAYNTVEAIGRINSVTVDNIIKFWYGETPNQIKL